MFKCEIDFFVAAVRQELVVILTGRKAVKEAETVLTWCRKHLHPDFTMSTYCTCCSTRLRLLHLSLAFKAPITTAKISLDVSLRSRAPADRLHAG